MRRLYLKPGARLAAFYATSLTVATLALGGATYTFARYTLNAELDARIRSEMDTLLRAEANEGRGALMMDVAARGSVPGLDGGYVLHDASGRRVAGALIASPAPLGWSDVSFLERDGNYDDGRALTVQLKNGDRLTVVEEAESLKRLRTALLAIFGFGFGVMLALALVGGRLLDRALRWRIAALTDTAAAIIDGDMARRMPVGAGDDEFDRLSATLNHMLDRIAVLLDNLRHVSADIAHDLRSPLMRLRVSLELAGSGADEATRVAAFEQALDRIDAIFDLFATILRISELEAGAVRRHFAPIALDRLVADVGEAFAPAIEDAGQRLSLGPLSPVSILGDRELIGQAIATLIDNVVTHGGAGTRLRLSVESSAGGSAEIQVRDDGPGIPASEHAHVLRRFGRGSHARQGSGHGLGLNLVSAVATAHGGALLLEDGAPGLIARLILSSGQS